MLAYNRLLNSHQKQIGYEFHVEFSNYNRVRYTYNQQTRKGQLLFFDLHNDVPQHLENLDNSNHRDSKQNNTNHYDDGSKRTNTSTRVRFFDFNLQLQILPQLINNKYASQTVFGLFNKPKYCFHHQNNLKHLMFADKDFLY